MPSNPQLDFALQCPVALDNVLDQGGRITMAHGGGGRMSQRLIESVFMPFFSNEMLDTRHDGAVFSIGNANLAFSTDSMWSVR